LIHFRAESLKIGAFLSVEFLEWDVKHISILLSNINILLRKK